MQLTGTIEKQTVGIETWALVTADAQTYELRNLPAEFQQQDLQVTMTGRIRDDVMSIAMIGPILEVESCTKL